MRLRLDWYGVAIGESDALVPIGVGGLGSAGGVEFGDLVFGEVPADGGEVLAELLFIARAHDDVGDGGALQEPIQSDLWNGLAGFFCDFLDGVDDLVEIFVVDLRAGIGGFVEARNFGDGASTADFAGETRPAKRTPDERADFLVERERH